MHALADLQDDFRTGVLGDGCPQGLTAPDPADLDRRFAVYRNNVMVALTGALAKRFPVIVRLVGQDFAVALFAEFARQHPPASPLMMEYGTGLPHFLEDFPPVAKLPYLSDIARLELARGRAYHAADVAPVATETLEALAAAPPDTLHLTLHPSVAVVQSVHPVHTLWSRNQPGQEATGPVDWHAESALVARRGFDVITIRQSAGDAAFLGALVSNGTLASASDVALRVDPEFDPAPVLAQLIGAGLVVAATIEPTVKSSQEIRP